MVVKIGTRTKTKRNLEMIRKRTEKESVAKETKNTKNEVAVEIGTSAGRVGGAAGTAIGVGAETGEVGVGIDDLEVGNSGIEEAEVETEVGVETGEVEVETEIGGEVVALIIIESETGTVMTRVVAVAAGTGGTRSTVETRGAEVMTGVTARTAAT